jgi:hypothetical protein
MKTSKNLLLTDFVHHGMAAVEHKFGEVRQELQSIIVVTTPIYENLLQKAFRGAPLYTGKVNGENRPIRYDALSKLLFSKEDGRLLIPMKLIESHLKEDTGSPMSNLGVELVRRAKAGDVEKSLFKYDKDGNYLGVEIGGKIMGADELRKIHRSKSCKVCQNPSSSKCSVCHSVSYCSADCQRADWPIHKLQCELLREGTILLK